MKIIICGAGQVGFNIARHLAMEGNDVIVIDTSPELIRRINDNLDAQGVVGHASRPDVLRARRHRRRGHDHRRHADRRGQHGGVPGGAFAVRGADQDRPRARAELPRSRLGATCFRASTCRSTSSSRPRSRWRKAIIRRLRVPGSFETIPLADDKVRLARRPLRGALPVDQHADQAADPALSGPQHRHRRPVAERPAGRA